jgi:hypothetical protein
MDREQRFSDDAAAGRHLLKSGNKIVNELEITADDVECSKRKVVLLKVLPAYKVFEDVIVYYGMIQVLNFIKENAFASFAELATALPAKPSRNEWMNIGGQLMPSDDINVFKEKIHTGKIRSWDAVHNYYGEQGKKYSQQKLKHALGSLAEITGLNLRKMDAHQFNGLLNSIIATKEWMTKGIYDSRAKDYSNPYRKMVYESVAEMNAVVGKLEDNSFIKQQVAELQSFKKEIAALKKKFKLS